MTTLYPGQRVWIGWTALCESGREGELLGKGTIYDGPFPPGSHVPDPIGTAGLINCTDYPTWIVVMDKYVGLYPYRIVCEPIIFPINDDGKTEEQKDENLIEA